MVIIRTAEGERVLCRTPIIVQFEGDGMAGVLRHIESVPLDAAALIGAVR